MAREYRWTVTVDRGKWLSGDVLKAVEAMDSSLRDEKSGLQCCLGFGMREAGASVKTISAVGLPGSVIGRVPDEELFAALTHLEIRASDANDDDSATTEAREARLKTLFAGQGIRLVFKGNLKDAITTAQKHYGKREGL